MSHGKTDVRRMAKFFMRERFGHPQFVAGGLLLLLALQALWLIGRGSRPQEVDAAELYRVQEGLLQLRQGTVAGTPSMARMEAGESVPLEVEDNEGYDPNHSPLWYLIAASPLTAWSPHGKNPNFVLNYWGWLARVPYLFFGVLLGASLWYVARRLYGNQGGYIALMLYCFAPGIVRGSALWLTQPEMGAAWGTFGTIFTAIAVAHTLYAPREVVLWNWRRILLLGLSLALAIGTQFSLVVLLPLALAFMLYVAPTRRGPAIAIWLAASFVASFLIYAAYGFHAGILWQGLRHAQFLGFTSRTFGMIDAYRATLAELQQTAPALLIALPAALFTYALWPRTRYFGNTAPLLVATLLLLLGFCSPHYPGFGFQVMAVPFFFVFIAGVAADLLETSERKFVALCVWGLLGLTAAWNILQLVKVSIT